MRSCSSKKGSEGTVEFNTSQTKVQRMTSSCLFIRATRGGPTSTTPLCSRPICILSLRREVIISEGHLLEVTCFHKLSAD